MRETGGTALVSSLVDRGERLDARSDSLNPSNSVAGIRLTEGWMMPVAGLGTVGKRTSSSAGKGTPVSRSFGHRVSLYTPTER